MTPPLCSILLPTRERLEYLRHAIETVRRQDDPRWEVIVQDNASTADVRGYVASLDEPRIRYARSDVALPVTENWNRALVQARGEYVVMLGDDDALAPGHLRRLAAVAARFDGPDAVYTAAYHLGYPGVFPVRPDGFFFEVANTNFLAGREGAFVLPRATARRCVEGALRFRRPFAFNMQHFALRRTLVDRIRARTGTFFESPYPDFYAACAVLLLAERVVAVPEPWTIIGITPRSYGSFFFSGREAEGGRFLRGSGTDEVPAELGAVLLPGSDMYTNWLLAMEALVRRFGPELGLALHPDRYRLRQILVSAQRGDPALRSALRRRLRARERPVEVASWLLCRAHARLSSRAQQRLNGWWERLRRRFGGYRVLRDLGSPPDAVAAFEQLERSGRA